MSSTLPLTIDVYVDVICPWCYVGKKRLDKTLQLLTPEKKVRVNWHPYELNPTMPIEGMERSAYRTQKFGSDEAIRTLDERVELAALAEGLRLRLDLVKHVPNTRDAHRLIWKARDFGIQNEIVDALFNAYFVEARTLDRITLPQIVDKLGWPAAQAKAFLESNLGLDEVAKASEEILEAGVRGVPFFLLNDLYGIAGAQTPELFLEAISDIEAMPAEPTTELELMPRIDL